MNQIWFWVIFLVFAVAEASIVGLTYKDDYDFAEKYRDDHYCDPLYWHPLHMPDECDDVLKKEINTLLLVPNVQPDNKKHYRNSKRKSFTYNSEENENPTRVKRGVAFANEYYDDNIKGESQQYSDYGIMLQESQSNENEIPTDAKKALESLSRDAKYMPSSPQITNTELGPTLVYYQPVSKKTQRRIEKMSGMKSSDKKKYNVHELIKSITKKANSVKARRRSKTKT